MSIDKRKKIEFKDYLKNKNIEWSDFMKLSKDKREQVFLRWKWSTVDTKHARDCEMTRRYLMQRIDEFMEQLEPQSEDVEYWMLIKAFEDRCFRTKKEIGLVGEFDSNPAVRDLTQQVMASVG